MWILAGPQRPSPANPVEARFAAADRTPAESEADLIDKHRLSHEVTIAHGGDAERTMVREGGPRAADVLASALVELSCEVEARSVVAEGGMAVVYRALDHTLGREVAIKVLKRDASTSVRAGFEREAALMARLDHPGIVPVYAISPADSHARLFAMKLVVGETIAELVDRDGPPRGRALAVMLRSVLRMCETLAYAHDRGVIHRDLKPENVMLGRYGECYIMDWGVALERGGAAPASDEIVGTPSFMAPEQARGQVAQIDERTDVFGLGAILYFILTGSPPYAGTTIDEVMRAAREGRTQAPELGSVQPPVPARLSDIVCTALAPAREHRYTSVMQLHDALEQFLFAGDWFARRRFAAGELIFCEGEAGDRAYIIESGTCEVFRDTGRQGAAGASDVPEQVSLRTIGSGEVIGELALFAAGNRTASVRALTPMTVLEVTREALELELPPGSWTRQIIDTLTQRFLSLDAH